MFYQPVTNDDDDDESIYSVAIVIRSKMIYSVLHLTLKDIIKDSVSNFTGKGLLEVEPWFNEFEACASTAGCSDIQTLFCEATF